MLRRLIICFLICLVFFTSACAQTDMYCLNIGKADCIILMCGGQTYMVDTGYEKTADKMLNALENLGIDRLDAVFITHNDKDHVGGLYTLLSSGIDVGKVYASGYSVEGTGSKNDAVIACAMHGTKVNFLIARDKVETENPQIYFDVAGPLRLDDENENNNSLVMYFETPDGNILLTGDMKTEEEYQLLKKDLIRKCNVLKVPFHGDDTATGSSFLKACTPRVGVISTSTQEESDTPARETLKRLAMVGCETYCTQDAPDAVHVMLQDGKVNTEGIRWTNDN